MRVYPHRPFIIYLLSPLFLGVIFGNVYVLPVHALGLSPPEEEIGYLPVGNVQTVAATISRSVDELSGNLSVTVTSRKSAAGFFHGDSSFTIQEGVREYTYLYNIIPDYPDQVDQELYVTFLLQPTTISTSGVGVISGVTQVVRFTTDIVAQPSGTSSGSGSSSGGGSDSDATTSPDEGDSTDEFQEPQETVEEKDTSSDTSHEETQEEETVDSVLETVPDETARESEELAHPQDDQSSPDQEDTPIVGLDQEKIQPEELTEEEPQTDIVYQCVDLESMTHQSEDVFYRDSDVVFSWLSPGQSFETEFLFLLTYESTVSADALVNQTKNPSISFAGLADGVYYFHLLDSSDPGQKIVTRRIMVDHTPPTINSEVVISSSFFFLPRSRFIALDVVDALSGVEDTHVTLNGKEIDVGEAGIPLRGLGFGEHRLTVESKDQAGNEQLAEFVIRIQPRYPVVQTIDRLLRLPQTILSTLFGL